MDSLSALFVHASGGLQSWDPPGQLDLHAQVIAIEDTSSEVDCDLRMVGIQRR